MTTALQALLSLTLLLCAELAALDITTTGALATARYRHTATLLPSGRLIVSGGYGSSGELLSCEIYDPNLGTWTSAASLAMSRHAHSATLLPTGNVLVVGGYNGDALGSCELYNPSTDVWTTTGALTGARYGHTATLLPSGKVLVTGGNVDGRFSATGEVYDPTSGAWCATSSMGTPRGSHTATLLPTGLVLVVGGRGQATCELYNPGTDAWTYTDPLPSERGEHSATLLPTDEVLIVGGLGSTRHASSLYLKPFTMTWEPSGSMATARNGHISTLVSSGLVLVTGGEGSSGLISSCEMFDRTSSTWSAVGDLHDARMAHTATLMPSGIVMVTGGSGPGPLASCELIGDRGAQAITGFDSIPNYTFGDPPFAITGVSGGASGRPVVFASDNPDVATVAGSTVTITGAGTAVITATQDGNALYLPTTAVTQTLTVDRAAQTISGFPRHGARFYGDTVDMSDVVGGGSGNPAVLTSDNLDVAAISGTTVRLVGAGTAVITATQAGNANYDAAAPETYSILANPAALTVTATDASRPFGVSNPSFTGTVVGVIAGDVITASYASCATPATPAGSYGPMTSEAITPTLHDAGARLCNYTVTVINGTLSIGQLGQVIGGFTAFTAKTYGDADWSITGVSGGASGEPVLFSSDNLGVATVAGSTVTITGAGTAVITATQVGTTNYTAATPVLRTLTVSPAALTVTATDASRAVGAANPEFTGSLVGVVGADAITATFTSSATAATPSGTYGPTSPEAITPVLHDPGSRLSNYTVSATQGTLTISPVGGGSDATPGGDGGGGCGVGGALALLLGILATSGLRQARLQTSRVPFRTVVKQMSDRITE